MKNRLTKILTTALFIVCVCIPATPALAATNPFAGVNCAQAANSTICQTKQDDPTGADTLTSSDGIIHTVTDLVALIGGAVAIIVIVLAGIRYITSNGDAEQVSKAKRAILYAVAGLVIIAVGHTIIQLVISGV